MDKRENSADGASNTPRSPLSLTSARYFEKDDLLSCPEATRDTYDLHFQFKSQQEALERAKARILEIRAKRLTQDPPVISGTEGLSSPQKIPFVLPPLQTRFGPGNVILNNLTLNSYFYVLILIFVDDKNY